MNQFILLQTNSGKKDRCKLQVDRSTVCHNIYYLNEHLRQSVTSVNRFCWWWNVEERPQELSLVDSEEVEVIARLSVCLWPGLWLSNSSRHCSDALLGLWDRAWQDGGGGKARWDKAGNQFLCAHRRVDPRPHPEYAPLTTRIVCSLPSLPRP